MHYSSNSFTSPATQLSIIPKDMDYAYTMGNRQISFYDIIMINKHYGCDGESLSFSLKLISSAACPAASSAKCKNGGVPNPRNCATCNCPLGYEGTLCDQRVSIPSFPYKQCPISARWLWTDRDCYYCLADPAVQLRRPVGQRQRQRRLHPVQPLDPGESFLSSAAGRPIPF